MSASDDSTLKVWDLKSGLTVATFHCEAGVLCCAIARRGIMIAGDDAGRVHFLVLEETGEPVV